jgi:hypothetical protein
VHVKLAVVIWLTALKTLALFAASVAAAVAKAAGAGALAAWSAGSGAVVHACVYGSKACVGGVVGAATGLVQGVAAGIAEANAEVMVRSSVWPVIAGARCEVISGERGQEPVSERRELILGIVS